MLIGLNDPRATDAAVVGSKAARLAVAVQAGLPVPDGVVVPVGGEVAEAELVAAARRLGGQVAVRSSGVAEDLPGASFAGVYDSFLDVAPADVAAAIRRCRASASADRSRCYRAGEGEVGGMAVLVQAMVRPEAAGVAFTADPLTGARDEGVVTAVAGLADRLVAGEVEGEEWRLVDGYPPRPIGRAELLSVDQVAAVAAVARRLESLFAVPQDVEWALADDGTVWVVQARPMTALPPPVTWPPPGPGLWACNFRLGEWLPEPVTPLFADWLLPVFDSGFQRAMADTAGASVPFPYGLVNGWYYGTPNPQLSRIPRAVVHSRGRLLRFMLITVALPSNRPGRAAPTLLRLFRDWHDRLLPDYRRLAATVIEDLDLAALAAVVEHVVETAGRHFWYLAVVGGAAWKVEGALRTFTSRRRLGDVDVAALLGRVTAPGPPAPHAVFSLDWYHPTAGEQQTAESPDSAIPIRATPLGADPDAETQALEARCAAALVNDPAALRAWTRLLELSRAFSRIREEQASALTLGWPLLRRCARRIGTLLTDAGQLEHPEQLFFLTRAELGSGQSPAVLADRHRTWLAQRRLAPPLTIGDPPPLLARSLRETVGPTRADRGSANELVGQPASPGRATGPARIVRSLDDFAKVRAGDVLVAPATAPAWSPLFGRVVAVVTDRGTAAAHSSILAREHGIPAVVATQDATRRLVDGMNVTVDGHRGRVNITGGQPQLGQETELDHQPGQPVRD